MDPYEFLANWNKIEATLLRHASRTNFSSLVQAGKNQGLTKASIDQLKIVWETRNKLASGQINTVPQQGAEALNLLKLELSHRYE